jgi:hypothetical protein
MKVCCPILCVARKIIHVTRKVRGRGCIIKRRYAGRSEVWKPFHIAILFLVDDMLLEIDRGESSG